MNALNPQTEIMKGVPIIGNIIPHSWIHHIKRPNGKFYMLAAYLLSDFVYWYRPKEIRDEATGLIVGYENKFAADKLQRSYAQMAEMAGCSKRQCTDACNYLESQNLITREFRTISISGTLMNNVLFVEIVALQVARISTMDPITKKSDRVMATPITKIRDSLSQKNEGGIAEIRDTNTETSTKTSTKTSDLKESAVPTSESITNTEPKAASQASPLPSSISELSTINHLQSEQNSQEPAGQPRADSAPSRLSFQGKDGRALTQHQLKTRVMAWIMYGGDINERYGQLSTQHAQLVRTMIKELNKSNFTVDEYMAFYRDVWRASWEYKKALNSNDRAGTYPSYQWIKTNMHLVRVSHNDETAVLEGRLTDYEFDAVGAPIEEAAIIAAARFGAQYIERERNGLFPVELGAYMVVDDSSGQPMANHIVPDNDGFKLFSSRWAKYKGPLPLVRISGHDVDEPMRPEQNQKLIDLWPAVKEALEESMPPATYDTFIPELEIAGAVGDSVQITAENAWAAQQANRMLKRQIGRTYTQIAGQKVQVEISCKSHIDI